MQPTINSPGPLHRLPADPRVSSAVFITILHAAVWMMFKGTLQPIPPLPKALQWFPIALKIKSKFLTLSHWVLQEPSKHSCKVPPLNLSPPLSCVLASVASFSFLNSKLLSYSRLLLFSLPDYKFYQVEIMSLLPMHLQFLYNIWHGVDA